MESGINMGNSVFCVVLFRDVVYCKAPPCPKTSISGILTAIYPPGRMECSKVNCTTNLNTCTNCICKVAGSIGHQAPIPRKFTLAEPGISYVIFILCTTLVKQNMKITMEIPAVQNTKITWGIPSSGRVGQHIL